MISEIKKSSSIFTIPIVDKKRAEIISIKSPEEFRKSIKEIRKGNYTLGDYRALILAQNRARAILNKEILSPLEKKQMEEISLIIIPKYK